MNRAEISGKINHPAEQNHRDMFGKKDLYRIWVQVERNSGVYDNVLVLFCRGGSDVDESIYGGYTGDVIVAGIVQAGRDPVSGRHTIFILAEAIAPGYDPQKNDVQLTGTICRNINVRKAASGREITEIMMTIPCYSGMEVCRIPMYAWDAVSRDTAQYRQGDRISINGRMQSRIYRKSMDGKMQTLETYEICIRKAKRESD